jgi:hypothetical protein
MKKKFTSTSAFFKLRVLVASVFWLAGVFIALGGMGLYLGAPKAEAQSAPGPTTVTASSPTGGPDVVPLVGPVCISTDLRDLPYIPPARQILKQRLIPYPRVKTGAPSIDTSRFAQLPTLIMEILRPVSMMPPPMLTFEGISFVKSGIDEAGPPDTNGDVGPNHYVQVVNQAFKVFDKNGNRLRGPTTFNSFFAPLGSTPCANENQSDPVVFYDQIADRWVITNLAFPGFPGTSFWECIGVSRTGDPVAGGWCFYALQHDPAHPNRLGDYPKFGLWPDAYYLTMNEFTNNRTFNGVRVYALDRASMIAGGPANAVGFTIETLTGLGCAASLVPASFRAGALPPVGRQEFLLAIGRCGIVQSDVPGWLFHVDFINPNNSTLGIGSDHSPNAHITVNEFVSAGMDFAVPQLGTEQGLDTLGDRMMTPVVYQNRNGTESLWADHTVIVTLPNGPTAIRWYQFDVSGGNFPLEPVQQQDWSNDNDGLWRWMPSIAVDENGNTAIGYSTSSATIFPSIRYAGRLATDPLGNLSQGEAIMTNGGGSQTGGSRWGDYTMTTIDPSDGMSFWHTNEYYMTTSDRNWSTRVGKFQFPAVGPRPTPTPRPHPTETPHPTLG